MRFALDFLKMYIFLITRRTISYNEACKIVCNTARLSAVVGLQLIFHKGLLEEFENSELKMAQQGNILLIMYLMGKTIRNYIFI